MLRQGRVTAGRTVIRETMSPNGVEDIGSERCIKILIIYSQFSSHTMLKFRVSTFYVILYYHICFLLTESTYDPLKTFFLNG